MLKTTQADLRNNTQVTKSKIKMEAMEAEEGAEEVKEEAVEAPKNCLKRLKRRG